MAHHSLTILRSFLVANKPQAKKRALQSEKRRQHNVSLRSMYRTYIKGVLLAIDGGKQSSAEEAYKAAVPVIDSMVNKGIMHKNKAARHKSRLFAKIKNMSAKS